ncbi:MAG: hypothetical protein J6S85_10735 [Methanobrevibacter sp.]|nr:hypothetical protein [Methanobrevibacter sp.]
MKRRKGKFVKESISSMDYAEQYYRKNKDKIKRLMPYIEDVNDFKLAVELDMFAPKTFSSKTTAKKQMDEFLMEKSGVDMTKLKAKRQAFNENGEEFGFTKIQQLNKKIGDFTESEFSISDYETVTGYYDIKNNSSAILARVLINEPGESPYEIYKFVSRSYLG